MIGKALSSSRDRLRVGKEIHPIGNRVTDEEIHGCGDGEIDQNFDQCIDLIFVAYRADLKKGKSGMHGKNQNGPEQDKEHINTHQRLRIHLHNMITPLQSIFIFSRNSYDF